MTDRWFPDGMPLPHATPDTAGFWEAARHHRLVVQRCTACGEFRHPPGPICPRCASFDLAWEEVSGRGTVFTFTVGRQPFLPVLRDALPYVIAVVELDGTGGTRMISNVVDAPVDDVHVGMAVEVAWEDMGPELTIPRFRPA